MVTVHRSGSLRFVIFVDDREPAHVHAFGDGEARIDIRTGRVLTHRRLSRRDLSRALAEVRAHQEALLKAWSEIHG